VKILPSVLKFDFVHIYLTVPLSQNIYRHLNVII